MLTFVFFVVIVPQWERAYILWIGLFIVMSLNSGVKDVTGVGSISLNRLNHSQEFEQWNERVLVFNLADCLNRGWIFWFKKCKNCIWFKAHSHRWIKESQAWSFVVKKIFHKTPKFLYGIALQSFALSNIPTKINLNKLFHVTLMIWLWMIM